MYAMDCSVSRCISLSQTGMLGRRPAAARGRGLWLDRASSLAMGMLFVLIELVVRPWIMSLTACEVRLRGGRWRLGA